MKKICITMFIAITLIFTGCSKEESTFDKAMSEGKLALASQEYEKAESMFKLAMEENSKDGEANVLHEQVSKYRKILELKELNQIDEALKLCEEIENTKSESKVVLDEVLVLKEELLKLNDEYINQINNSISEAEELIKNKEFKKAKDSLNSLLEDTKDKSNLSEISDINNLIEVCNKGINEEKRIAGTKDKEVISQESTNRNMPLDLKEELFLYVDDIVNGLQMELEGSPSNVANNGLGFFRSAFTYACDDGFVADNGGTTKYV